MPRKLRQRLHRAKQQRRRRQKASKTPHESKRQSKKMQSSALWCAITDTDILFDDPSIALNVRYKGHVVCRLTPKELDQVAKHSFYLQALKKRWKLKNNDKILDIPPVPGVECHVAVEDILTALKDNEVTWETLGEGAIGSWISTIVQHQRQVIIMAFYLGCQEFFVPRYCALVDVYLKKRVPYALYQCGHHPEAQALLNTEGFFEGFARSQIPIIKEFATFDLETCMKLLRTYFDKSSEDDNDLSQLLLVDPIQQFTRLVLANEPPMQLTVEEFGMYVVQNCCKEADTWQTEDFDTLFSILPKSPHGYSKPDGLESLVIRIIQLDHEVPPVLRMWQLDESLIAHTLCEANRLHQAIDYPCPERLIGAVVESWSPRKCAQALKDNQGGILTLLAEGLTDDTAHWLANIWPFQQACCLLNDGHPVQFLLFRRLFMHTCFDPQLPPSLLARLVPLISEATNIEGYRDKVLLHAIKHLERDIDGTIVATISNYDFPWGLASTELTQRAARALRDYEGSKVWRQLDLGKLAGQHWSMSRFLA